MVNLIVVWVWVCISPFIAARYHSLVIDRATFPEDELEITALTEDGMIMGVQHKRYPHIQVCRGARPHAFIAGPEVYQKCIIDIVVLPMFLSQLHV